MSTTQPLKCSLLNKKDNDRVAKKYLQLDEDLRSINDAFPTNRIQTDLLTIRNRKPDNQLYRDLSDIFAGIEQDFGHVILGKYKKFLILKLIGEIDSKIKQLNLPKSIVALYPDTLDYVLKDLFTINDESYLANDTGAVRDLRICALRTLPCGGRLIEDYSYLPNTIYRYKGLSNNMKCLAFIFFKLRGMGPFYRTHLEERFMKYFSEEEFAPTFLRIAALMRQNPSIRGVVGTSWFYDPQLEKISPWLTYLRSIPEKHGAFLRYNGSSPIYVKWATATSKKRRALYEKGEYMPGSYTLMWPRKNFLHWADTVSGSAG